MGSLPIFPSVCMAVGISTAATNSLALDVPPSATANVKGAYVQATASTSFDATFVSLQLGNLFSVANRQYAIDMAVGAGGSELVLANNLMVADSAAVQTQKQYCFPCNIAAGTRIAFRCQVSSSTTIGARVYMQLFGGDVLQPEGYAGVDAIGFVAASTRGATVNSSTVTKGPYTQVTAATTRDYAAISVTPCLVVGQHIFDVAIGAGGSEQVILPNMASIGGNPWASPAIPIQVPLGTRIAARGEATVANAMDVVVYGYYQ